MMRADQVAAYSGRSEQQPGNDLRSQVMRGNILTEVSEGVQPLRVGLSPVHVRDQLGSLQSAVSPPS